MRLRVTFIALLVLLAACTGASPTPTPTPQPAGDIDPWRVSPAEHRAAEGEQFDYDCPAGGSPGTVWGTDTYTDDSSACAAGVHVGVITVEDGGTVTVEMRPGEDSYEGSERNGIESFDYGSWGGSFVVVEPEG